MHFAASRTRSDGTDSRTLTLRPPDDRRCPACRAVALAYDTDAGTARCRACGELDGRGARS